MPPSLLSSSSGGSTSITASLISVSSPESQQEVAAQEEKGKAALARLRGEVEAMLAEGGAGVEKARRRVQELRECVGVWKGTAEEKARERWVRELEGWMEGEIAKKTSRDGNRGGTTVVREELKAPVREELPSRTGSGAGFLQRLREEIYLE